MKPAEFYGVAMRVFLIGCVFGLVLGLFVNTMWWSYHGPIYPALDVAFWSVTFGCAALLLGLADWLMRKSTYQCGARSFSRGFGARLLAIGLVLLLLVGTAHADKRNSDPTLKDESRLVPLLFAGGAFGFVGAVLWYLGDRKSAFLSLTAGRHILPPGRESEPASND
jgi:hypothetical protein